MLVHAVGIADSWTSSKEPSRQSSAAHPGVHAPPVLGGGWQPCWAVACLAPAKNRTPAERTTIARGKRRYAAELCSCITTPIGRDANTDPEEAPRSCDGFQQLRTPSA